MAPFDLDACIEQLLKKQLLQEALLRELCEKTKEVLMRESNVVHVTAPVTVVGDIHGQYVRVRGVPLGKLTGGSMTCSSCYLSAETLRRRDICSWATTSIADTSASKFVGYQRESHLLTTLVRSPAVGA